MWMFSPFLISLLRNCFQLIFSYESLPSHVPENASLFLFPHTFVELHPFDSPYDDPPESLARTSTSSRSSSASSSSSSSSSSSIVSQDQDLGFRIELDWSSSDDEDQVALKLQSQLMVALPMPQDTVVIELVPRDDEDSVDLSMKVVKRRDPVRGITMAKAVNSGLQSDGTGVLTRLLRSEMVSSSPEGDESVPRGGGQHWTSLAVLSICGRGLSI